MRGGPTTGGLARVRSPSRSTPGRVTARIDGRLRVGYLCRGGWRYRHGQAWAGLCAVLSRRLWSRRRERGRGDVGGPQQGWCTRRTAGGNRPVRRLAPCWRTREASVVCVARGRVVTMPLPSGCSAAASAHGRHPGMTPRVKKPKTTSSRISRCSLTAGGSIRLSGMSVRMRTKKVLLELNFVSFFP